MTVNGCHLSCCDLVTPTSFHHNNCCLMAESISHTMSRLLNNIKRFMCKAKYLAVALCTPSSYLTYTKKKTIISLCSFLSFLDRACLCLNSFSAPDAFLDILSQEIIRFSLPADIRAEPVSDAALSGGT